MPETITLEQLLIQHTKEGELYEKLPENKVRCYACGHRCLIFEGKSGICKVRFNKEGKLLVPTGYVGALQCDPIEKKPFFHALPGRLAMSFGMLGCDFHCGYCQNWITSQALRDPLAMSMPTFITPDELVGMAKRYKARVVASTYNEPLITSEWAVEIFKVAKQQGFKTAYISNGNATEEVLDYLKPWVDLYKVDLKSFSDKNYRELGGQLKIILNAIQLLVKKGFWVEIVTLIVPGFNDSDDELRQIAEFLVSVSADIPWHVTAFHQDYKMMDRNNTPARTLLKAAEIGQRAGLHYIYAGNLPGMVGNLENTYCPSCKAILVERLGYQIMQNNIKENRCPKCHTVIPGVWE